MALDPDMTAIVTYENSTLPFDQASSVHNVYTAQVEIICNVGYQPDGESLLTCLEDGLWSHQKPSCQSKF